MAPRKPKVVEPVVETPPVKVTRAKKVAAPPVVAEPVVEKPKRAKVIKLTDDASKAIEQMVNHLIERMPIATGETLETYSSRISKSYFGITFGIYSEEENPTRTKIIESQIKSQVKEIKHVEAKVSVPGRAVLRKTKG